MNTPDTHAGRESDAMLTRTDNARLTDVRPGAPTGEVGPRDRPSNPTAAELDAASPAFAVGDALLLVDPQNDFCPGGSLPVTDGDQVMPVLSTWAAAAHAANAPVFISRDWHPPETTHFATQGGAWPPHCIQGTRGADFHADLQVPSSAVVVSKGMGPTEDAYSAFQARDENGTPLIALVRARGVEHLYIMGLATDYCVQASALGGIEAGLHVSVVRPGCRAVEVRPGDGTAALERMHAAGAQLIG